MKTNRGFWWLAWLVVLLASCPARSAIVAEYQTPTGVGRLERTDQGDTVLHLAGSYYDMGVQHAMLLKSETRAALRAGRMSIRIDYPYLSANLVLWMIYREVYLKQAPYMPAEFVEEMRGLSDASGVPLWMVQAFHAATFLTSCSGAVAWGPATRDGELYFMRSNDVAANFDPLTGKTYQDSGMIVIYEPMEGEPYMILSWPGFIGASDGMNSRGIAVGNMSDPSSYETPAGLPMLFRIKQTLAKAGTLEEALEWMTREPRGGGYNFLVADAKAPSAAAIEMDARTVYVGGWDGPAESNRYTYQGRDYSYTALEDLLTRTNHPLSSELIAHHEKPIDDGVPHSPLSAQRYQDLRARLAAAYGSLDLETMMGIMRDHYNSISWETGVTLGVSSHQFAYAPRTGEILVAFSHGNPLKLGRPAASAFNQPVRHYNFFELLGRGKK